MWGQTPMPQSNTITDSNKTVTLFYFSCICHDGLFLTSFSVDSFLSSKATLPLTMLDWKNNNV